MWIVAVALVGLLLLAIKWRAVSRGFRYRSGAPRPLLLPRVPTALRWLGVVVCLGGGAYLQAMPFLAAGTLAFAAGVVLAVRGPARRRAFVLPRAWRRHGREAFGDILRSSPRGAIAGCLLDGTSLLGAPLAAAAALGAVFLQRGLWTELDTPLVDAVGIDMALLFGAVFLTGRRGDLEPSPGAGAARLLARLWRALARAAKKAGSELYVLVGADEANGEARALRLVLAPPPAGTCSVEVALEAREGIRGWIMRPVARLRRKDGTEAEVRAWGGLGLARKLRRELRRAAELAA
jgi:hypothetical protein